MSREQKSYQAIINKIVDDGKHGPYAVAFVEEIGMVTFSLKSRTWEEGATPDPGSYVVLSGIRRKRAGWRAEGARYLVPSDVSGKEQAETPERRKEHHGN
ncbi:MAG TPA: hypothetical protein VJB69_02280 [Candidatus Paceibacterota bacterium]